jgi:two-component system cell cycle response regulator DivK
MRVLLVDDDEDGRNLIRVMLEKLGHEVVEAVGGREAVELALDRDLDLVFMDLSMPEVDGFLATAALRAISSFSRLPIVATTGFPERLSGDEARAAGCDAYLKKPLSLDDISAVLKKFQGEA